MKKCWCGIRCFFFPHPFLILSLSSLSCFCDLAWPRTLSGGLSCAGRAMDNLTREVYDGPCYLPFNVISLSLVVCSTFTLSFLIICWLIGVLVFRSSCRLRILNIAFSLVLLLPCLSSCCHSLLVMSAQNSWIYQPLLILLLSSSLILYFYYRSYPGFYSLLLSIVIHRGPATSTENHIAQAISTFTLQLDRPPTKIKSSQHQK